VLACSRQFNILLMYVVLLPLSEYLQHCTIRLFNASSAYDVIIELFEKLKPFITRLEMHDSLGEVVLYYRALEVNIFRRSWFKLVICSQSSKLIWKEG